MDMKDRLDMVENKLSNTTCPEMLESLIYERKSICTNWKAKVEALRQEELKRLDTERKQEGILKRFDRWFRG